MTAPRKPVDFTPPRPPMNPEDKLKLANQRIEELCQAVNTLAGFRKVRPEDYKV